MRRLSPSKLARLQGSCQLRRSAASTVFRLPSAAAVFVTVLLLVLFAGHCQAQNEVVISIVSRDNAIRFDASYAGATTTEEALASAQQENQQTWGHNIDIEIRISGGDLVCRGKLLHLINKKMNCSVDRDRLRAGDNDFKIKLIDAEDGETLMEHTTVSV
jgi:hypothetical protein